MNKLQQVEQAIAQLTPDERAELLLHVAANTERANGIESRSEVCGGEACIARTRIPVWVLEQARRLGSTEADLLKAYPTLRAVDLVNAWNYVRDHESEIEADIRANEDAD
jgi:uncharacterized protein (DUF433 family)